MFRTRVRPTMYDRIGSRYKHFFDFDHFLGRNALEDTWVSDHDWVRKTAKNYKIQVPLPGFSKKDINVSLQDQTLIIKILKNGNGSKSKEQIEIGKRYYQLPANLDLESIKVRFKNGLLKVSVPYLEHQQTAAATIEVA